MPLKKVESAKKTSSAQLGSTSNVVKDMLSSEWALKYQEDHKRTILCISKTLGVELSREGKSDKEREMIRNIYIM